MRQKIRFVDLMNIHHESLFGKFSVTTSQKAAMWTRISTEINTLGPKRTVVQWKICWTSLKKIANDKLIFIEKYRKRTNGKPNCPTILSDQDKIVIRICNKISNRTTARCTNANSNFRLPVNGFPTSGRHFQSRPSTRTAASSLQSTTRRSIAHFEGRSDAYSNIHEKVESRPRKSRASKKKSGPRSCLRSCVHYRRGLRSCGNCFLSKFRREVPSVPLSDNVQLSLEREISSMCDKQDELIELLCEFLIELRRVRTGNATI